MSDLVTTDEDQEDALQERRRRDLKSLTHRQKAFLIAYVQATNFDKLDAWCLARYNHPYDYICKHLQNKYGVKWADYAIEIRHDCHKQWKMIEKKFGGIKNVMDFIGLDDTRLFMEHKKLMNAKKPMVVNKNTGEVIWYDDAGAQVKNLEVLHKVKGNIDLGGGTNINIGQSGNPLHIDFGSGDAIPQDNMTINGDVNEPIPIQATVKREEPVKRGPGRPRKVRD